MIILDTHSWIWFIDSPSKLSPLAAEAIEESRSSSQVYISSISTWEIYMLEQKGRLRLKISATEWVRRCERLSFLQFIAVDNEIARLAVCLPDFHSDPADRIIVATAQITGAQIVSRDSKILNYKHVQSVW